MCDAVLPGIVELLGISMLIGLFNLFNTIFGVCFVIRNKVDVPVYEAHRRSSTASSEKQSASPLIKKGGSASINNA